MLLRQTLLYLPAQLLGPLCQFIGIVLWTHWLGPRDMGLLALILVAQELAFVAAIGWFSLYSVRYAGGLAADGKLAHYLATEGRLLLLVTAALVPLTVALVWYLDDVLTIGLVAAAVAYAVTRTATQHLQDRARAMQSVAAYTVLQVTGPALGMLLALAAVMMLEASPRAILAGYALGHGIGLAVTPWVMPSSRFRGRADRSILAAAFAYGWPFIIGSPAIWLCSNALRYLVDWFEGMVAVGLVTAGWGLGQRATSFAALLVAVAGFPLAVRRTHDEGISAGMSQLDRNGLLLLLVLAPATAGLVILREPLSSLLVAAPYRDMTAMVLPWAAIGGAVRSVRLHFTNQVFLLHERPKTATLVDVFDAIATVAGCTMGLWLASLYGAVVGATVAAAAALAFSVGLGMVQFGFRPDWGGILRVAAATAIMLAGVAWTVTGTPLMRVALGTGVGVVLYGCAVLIFLPDARRIVASAARKCGFLPAAP